MNNEPVAWTTDKLDTNEWEEGDYQITVTKEKWSKKQIPLYTHPVKELTDEEIEGVINNIAHYGSIAKNDYVIFARAILRKAQEK